MSRSNGAVPGLGLSTWNVCRRLALLGAHCCLWLTVFSVLSPALVANEEALPSLREMYRRYIDENGGMSNYKSITTVQLFAKVEPDSGAGYDLQIYLKRPDKVRLILKQPGGILDRAYDGENGWMRIRPAHGEVVISDLKGEDLEALRQDSSMEGLFYLVGAREDWIQSMAFDTVHGQPAIRLEISPQAGVPYEVLWLSRENYQELQTQRTISAGASEQVETVYFSEFEKDRGVWFSSLSEYYLDGARYQTIRLSEVRLNVGLYDHFFKKP